MSANDKHILSRNGELFYGNFWFLINIVYKSMSDLKEIDSPRVTPLKYSRRLMFTSSFIFIIGIFAYTLGNCMDFAIWDILSVIASINYWRDARRDWRRKCDMIIGIPLYIYHGIVAYIELYSHFVFYTNIYFIIFACCAGLYFISFFSSNKKLGQITHSMMHIIGVITNIGMYYYLSQVRFNLISTK
eukprot:520601_1